MAVLLVAVAAVAIAVALPLKIWLGQRSQISSLATQTSAAQRSVTELQAQHKQWQQPGYVEQQARQRLHYVIPGQKTYVVFGTPHGAASAPTTAARSSASSPHGPWYSQLWSSVQAAGSSHR